MKKNSTKRQDGQALVEFAMVAPLLIAILIGGLDMSIFQWKKLVSSQAAYSGAALAAQQYEDDDSDVVAEIRAMADFIPTSDITINRSATLVNAGDSVEVSFTLTGPWTPQLFGMAAPTITCKSKLIKEERDVS